MAVEYARIIGTDTHDVIGIFKSGSLEKTAKIRDINEFLEHIKSKNPKTVKGTLRMITTFNKNKRLTTV